MVVTSEGDTTVWAGVDHGGRRWSDQVVRLDDATRTKSARPRTRGGRAPWTGRRPSRARRARTGVVACALFAVLACGRPPDAHDPPPARAEAAPQPVGEPTGAATFDSTYRAEHGGRVSVSLPEAYELVNIAIALTEYGRANPLVYQDTEYFRRLDRHFEPVRNHSFVAWLDAEMRADVMNYFRHKMSAASFVFDEAGRIRRSPVYHSTNFTGQPNTLVSRMEEMQAFADEGRFRDFFEANRPLYREQVAFFENGIDVGRMVDWLETNFPAVDPFDHVRVVFSPLVYSSQSVTWLEDSGFTEIQPHVNFPYPSTRGDLGASAEVHRRGLILFTELNHGFINPTQQPYEARIGRLLTERDWWAEADAPASNYAGPGGVFNEMMNWALIGPYLSDVATPEDLDALLERIDRTQTRRGFRRAPAFHAFLLGLYRTRPPGTPLADLYPQILDWFERYPDEAGGRP